MIYPDAELDEAGNYSQGHVPWEIPSSTAAEERLRWFTFDQNSGAEKLYFVFTREPLPTVPIEDDLITYCRENERSVPGSRQRMCGPRLRRSSMNRLTSRKNGKLWEVANRAGTAGSIPEVSV